MRRTECRLLRLTSRRYSFKRDAGASSFLWGAEDGLGAAPATVELPEGATVGALLDVLRPQKPAPALQGIAVSVNAEYAAAAHVLHEGDEVGLLPPVSGGTARAADVLDESRVRTMSPSH